MKKLVIILALALLPCSAIANETINEAAAGERIISTDGVPSTSQFVKFSAADRESILIDFPGASTSGLLFSIFWNNKGSLADTLWKFYPNFTDRGDSSKFVVEGGQSKTMNLFWGAEGDTIVVDKGSAGDSYGEFAGAKNLRGLTYP